MSFFKRILNKDTAPAEPAVPEAERRSEPRYTINPQFPLKVVISFIGRDDSGAPMSSTRHGWNWKGRLIECSDQGARLQLGPGIRATPGEACDLKLSVNDHEITVPSCITHVTVHPEGLILGLAHDLTDATVRRDYRQLLEVIALGSTLRLQGPAAQPDPSGYLVEYYTSPRPSRLTVWRHPADRSVAAFEFQLEDNLVRAAAGHTAEFMSDIGGQGSRPASAEKCLEIGRLFTWVVPNIAPVVPEDVRRFLQHHVS